MRIFKLVLMFNFFVVHQLQSAENDYGKAHASISELAQFEYLRGIWRVEIEKLEDDKTFKKLENIATIKAYYHQDGKSFQTVFTTSNGAFTTDIRTYNIAKDKWDILFMNANGQRWHRFQAELVDGIMTSLVIGGYSGNEDFDIKTLDINVTDNGFTKEVYNRPKGSHHWQKELIMTFTRGD